MTQIRLDKVNVEYDSGKLLSDVSLDIGSNELVVVLGSNGAGKSTLLKTIMGYYKKYSGISLIDNLDSRLISTHQRALKVSYLPQIRSLAWPISVVDTVALGRFAHGVTLGSLSDIDRLAVDRAIKTCHLEGLSERRTDTLSGGELARVHCARALASDAPMFLADEPVAALDPKHQLLLMNRIRQFVDDGGGALVVLHDPALAAQFADRIVWMKQGSIVSDGTVSATMTAEQLASVYQIDAAIEILNGRTTVVTYGVLD